VTTDADWDIAGDHYRVRVDGVWLDVPEESVVTAPNPARRWYGWL